jgi:hypothetical protein
VATQRISLDPALWNRTRRRAFDTGTTATALVSLALAEYLDRTEKPQGRLADPQFVTLDPSQQVPPESLIPEAVIPVIDRELRRGMKEVELYEVSVTADKMPWDGPVIVQDALPPAAVINDPKEVGAAIAKVALAAGREFHPVPKPTSTKKPSTRARR